MVTKQELLVTINELETKLDSRNVVYDVANISIKSLKVELQNYLSYLVTTDNDNAVTNLTKHITTNSTINADSDIRKHDNIVTGFNSDDQVMQQLGTYTTGDEISIDNVVLPEIKNEIEKIEVKKDLTNVYSNEDGTDLAVSGSGQDSIFWLRKVYIEITNQVLSEQQETRLKQLQTGGNNSGNEILARSTQFKNYLTFRCEELSIEDKQYLDRLNWIVEIDPVFGDNIVYPDWTKVSKIKFPTIIRILKYKTPNNLVINNECLINRYFGRDELLRCPMLIALDILTDNIGVNHNNSVLASALRLDIGNSDRTVSIRKSTNGINIDKPLHTSFTVPCDQRESITNSVAVRSIGKVKTRTNIGKIKGNKPSKQRDSWQLLSVNRNSVENEIIAINSAKYRDCVLVFKRYQLEYDSVTKKHDHPQWLLPTQNRYGIKDNEVVGYVAIKYPNGEIEKIGIVHTKYVKKQDKTVLWFTLLEKTATTIQSQVVNTGKDNLIQYVKYIKDGATIKKQLTTRLVPETTLATVTEINKIEIDPQVAIFLSLYGLCHNVAIKPAKLNTINNESKHINVNWSILTGLKVAPIDKQGNIQWLPKLSCPFTLLA